MDTSVVFSPRDNVDSAEGNVVQSLIKIGFPAETK
jgi:hypothetical protein